MTKILFLLWRCNTSAGRHKHRLTVAGTERRLRRVDQVKDAARSQPGEAQWLGEALSQRQGEGVIGARLPHCMFTCWWAGLSGSGPGEVISSATPHPHTPTPPHRHSG